MQHWCHSRVSMAVADGLALIWRQGICNRHVDVGGSVVTSGIPDCNDVPRHYSDVMTSAMASQIAGVVIVYQTVCSGADQRKHQSSASLNFVTGEFPAQRTSNAENVSIWWRHHDTSCHCNQNIIVAGFCSKYPSTRAILNKRFRKYLKMQLIKKRTQF